MIAYIMSGAPMSMPQEIDNKEAIKTLLSIAIQQRLEPVIFGGKCLSLTTRLQHVCSNQSIGGVA